MECTLPKVLQKCSLTQTSIFSLWKRTSCIKLRKNEQGVVLEAKHKPRMLAVKNI